MGIGATPVGGQSEADASTGRSVAELFAFSEEGQLSRTLKRMAAECQAGALEVVNHGRAAKSLTEASRQRMQESYGKLLGLTRSVVREAGWALERAREGRLPKACCRSGSARCSRQRYCLPEVCVPRLRLLPRQPHDAQMDLLGDLGAQHSE